MPSNHLILCHRLLFLPSVFPGIRVFSNESVLRIRWPKYWSFSFSNSLVTQTVKPLPAMRETRVRSLGWEDPLEKEMATHPSTLAWKIPWTEEPGRLQSVGSQSRTRLSNFTFTFQWIFRADFLYGWLVWSCSPRDSQGSSPTPQFKSYQFFSAQPSLWSASCI